MSDANRKVVVIGGGVTGLATTYYLQKEAREKGIPLDVTLLEASHRLGGKVQTTVKDGFVIEKGPDSFLARKLSASRLVHEAGLSDKLVYNSSGKSFVLAGGSLHPMPGGAVMGIPTQIAPFVASGLFSILGKLRASADFVLPRSNISGDQSLGVFFRRRLGDEVVENLIEPLLSGIYAGDIDQLSLMSTFPQFYHVEQKHRSLILGMKSITPPKVKTEQPKSAKGMFLTVTTGLQSIVEAIEEKLQPHSVSKGIRVKCIQKKANRYLLELSNDTTIEADSVVIATPHQATYEMLSGYQFAQSLKDMAATSVATVALAFPKSAIKKDINGTGFVVSRNSDYAITACTWTHKKWPHTTPEGYVLLRCYVGRPGAEAIVDQSDDDIVKIVLDDLNKTMAITENPSFSVVTRWRDAMPQYTVGHKERIELVKEGLNQELPGIFLAGSSYEGLGVPDCIDQGEAAVKKVLQFLHETKKELIGIH